jgi:hypothetical protein
MTAPERARLWVRQWRDLDSRIRWMLIVGAVNLALEWTAPTGRRLFLCPCFLPGGGEYNTFRGNQPAVPVFGLLPPGAHLGR